VLGGVAAGLADHLGWPLIAVRAAFVVLAGFGGAGVLAYALLWAFVPEDTAGESSFRRVDAVQVVGLLALGGAVLILGTEAGFSWGGVVWPLVLGGIGVAIVWHQADTWREAFTDGRFGMRGRAGAVLRVLAGAALLVLGLTGFLAKQGQLRNARTGLISTVVVVGGIALITGPWWLRTVRDLSAERRDRIRAEERADIAAHVHDSVLHTLALIQRSAADPREVARLARSQERELRSWLYRPERTAPGEGSTFLGALEEAAASVEESHGVRVEVVGVGDAPLDDRLGAVVLAAREALVNAAKYSGVDTVSTYAEVEDGAVTVFVRDRGTGFDFAAVPDDRHGIRGSIVGRLERAGGTATVRSAPGEGTEVELTVRRSAS